jgi:hypothetical protein
MFDKTELLIRIETLSQNPIDYDLMLDVTMRMYQEKCTYDGRVELCKAIRNRADTGLLLAKNYMDIFISLGVFCESNLYVYVPVYGKIIKYHVNKIKKEYFKISDLYYLINNNITYSTYDRLHRKEKLDEIFGDNIK